MTAGTRSQHQNIELALRELERRLGKAADRSSQETLDGRRRAQILTGERPVKQWTWNDQRSEVLDHQTGQKYPFRSLMQGRFELLLN